MQSCCFLFLVVKTGLMVFKRNHLHLDSPIECNNFEVQYAYVFSHLPCDTTGVCGVLHGPP